MEPARTTPEPSGTESDNYKRASGADAAAVEAGQPRSRTAAVRGKKGFSSAASEPVFLFFRSLFFSAESVRATGQSKLLRVAEATARFGEPRRRAPM
ncbi:hypothetical protein V5799_012141 [Amblyomma americanum]|uniref:Uncharacterized protein n=1 Tax=Amblyomma americanum TaxID=6943 RepID=A0AAQ4EEV3_AMBAM